MNVKKIEISRVLGVEELAFEPGKVTVIRGQNGSGKTSILTAIQTAIGGGKEARLLRNGADQGKTVLVLDDEMTVERKVGKGEGLKVNHPVWGTVSKPQTVLDGLVDKRALNPAHFLLPMSKKERTKLLLEVVDLKVTHEEIATLLASELGTDVTLEVDAEGLELIDFCRKHIYDQRTGINATAEDKSATIRQLGESLPEDPTSLEIDMDEQLKSCDLEIETLLKERAERASGIEQWARDQVDGFSRELGEQGAAWAIDYNQRYSALQEQLRALEQEKRDHLAERDRKLADKREEVRLAVAKHQDDVIAEMDPKITEAKERRAALVQQAQDVAKHRNTAKLLGTLQAQAAELVASSKRHTSAIEALDRLKVEKMSELPIHGVDIRDGELFVDDVPWDFVNRARQVEIAFALAKLRMGSLKLICVDNMECLDSESFEAFCQEAASDPDLQLIVTRVADTPLEIITTDGEVPA